MEGQEGVLHHTCGRYPKQSKGLEETEQMSKRDEDSGVLSVSAESQPETQSERCAAKGGRSPESEPLPVVASGRVDSARASWGNPPVVPAAPGLEVSL